MVYEQAIHTVFTKLAFSNVKAILGFVGARAHVAVFTKCNERIVIAVFAFVGEHAHFWCFFEEFGELVEKGLVKVIRLAIVSRVPCVRPPACLAVYGKRGVQLIKCNNVF